MHSDSDIKYLTLKEWTILEKVKKSPRNSLIVNILYTSGCTVNELVNIKLSEFSFETRTLKIHAKNSRNHEPRTVFLSHNLVDEIKAYLASEHPGKHITPYLLASRQSSKLTTKRVRQIVQKISNDAGIKDKNNPQILRYTHIVHAFKKGVPIPAIQKQVGIKRSRAIQIFNELKSETNQDAYQAFLD